MYLEQVDIDAFFPHRKVMVGPLSPGLNAIFGEAGAGKTAIIDFLRAVMLGGMRWNTSTAGRVVWCDTDGLLVCRREVDGTADGRLTFERLGRDGRSVFEGHAAIQGKQLAAEWIDAIVCPLGNALEQSRRALAAARHAGIEVAGRDEETPEYRATRLRLEEIERELAYRGHGVDTIESLELRRQQLRDQLQRLPTEVDQMALERWREEMRRAESEWTSAKRELHRCETQRAELLRGIDAVRHELATMAPVPADSAPRYALTEQERRHLEDLDDRLVRWRRTLREIRQVRDQLDERATDLRINTEVVQGGLHDRADARRPLYHADQHLETARRRLDWLVDRYHRDLLHAPEEASRLAEALRAARDELNQVCESLSHRDAIETSRQHRQQILQLGRCEQELLSAIDHVIADRAEVLRHIAEAHQIPAEQLTSAFGNWCRCEDHPHLAQWLLSEACPPRVEESEAYWSRRHRLEGELADLEAELVRCEDRLEHARRTETQWREEVERLPMRRPVAQDDRALRARLQAELTDIENRLHALRRNADLHRERDQLLARLRTLEPRRFAPSRFCLDVSHWLQRLSAGALQRFEAVTTHGERVDGRSLEQLSNPEAEVVALALRMTIADHLRRTQQPVPVLVHNPSVELARRVIENTAPGNQVVFLTSQRAIAEAVNTFGGKVTYLNPPAIAPVAPLAAEYRREPVRVSTTPAPLYDVNRELDTAWREVYGFYDNTLPGRRERLYARRQEEDFRAPLYGSVDWDLNDRRNRRAKDNGPRVRFQRYDESYLARRADRPLRYEPTPVSPAKPVRHEEVEPRFFLTEESPVDQAPSVDAVIAARLHGLGIHRVGQLLAAEPALLAERLALSGVSAREVRQWQDEARMVCHVPKLRPFDARVLVGCGVNDPHQLAKMHPTQLLERVQSFLATDRGRHILNSGSSYELSRITNWIVSANRSLGRPNVRVRTVERESAPFADLQYPAGHSLYRDLTGGEAAYSPTDEEREELRRRRREREAAREVADKQAERDELRRRRARAEADAAERKSKKDRAAGRARPQDRPQRTQARPVLHTPAAATTELRFFLNRQAPIVDAPTIGPRLAEKLEAIGIRTVGDLLDGDCDTIADALRIPKVTSQTVRTWQLQSAFVCRVPGLRGHDAQLLVAAGVESPEQLATCQPSRLLDQVLAVSRTAEGKRYLRGSPAPDLNEVTEWVQWAHSSRALYAA